MSVSNQTNKIYGSGNGVTTTFSYPFKIFDISELYAYTIDALGNVTGPLTYNTNFTATISSVTEGGTITFVVPPPSGTTWFLKRLVPYTQTAVIPSEGTFPGKQFENQLDLITMMVIQDQEAVSRCLQLSATYTGSTPVTVPFPQAGLALGWDPITSQLTNLAVTSVGTIAVPISDSNLQTITSANKVNVSAITGTLPTSKGGTGATGNANAANGPAILDGSGLLLTTVVPLVIPTYVKITDIKSQNTAGGSSTSGSWIDRVLNNIDADLKGIASLGSNHVTLPAGSYRCLIRSPFYNPNSVQLRLQNITDSTTLLIGSNAACNAGNTQVDAWIQGYFTLSASKALAVQYQVANSVATQGLGVLCNFTSEIYTVAEFTKVA